MPSRVTDEKVPHWYPKEIPVVSLIGVAGYGQAIRVARKGEKKGRQSESGEKNGKEGAGGENRRREKTRPTPARQRTPLRRPTTK